MAAGAAAEAARAALVAGAAADVARAALVAEAAAALVRVAEATVEPARVAVAGAAVELVAYLAIGTPVLVPTVDLANIDAVPGEYVPVA